MPDFNRRDFLTGAAAAAAGVTAGLAGTRRAEAGDPSFMNNVPDPLLAEKELPTFKFALEKSEGRVSGQSYAKEATVRQLPVSKGVAGVIMGLAPGVMRELHWHATAAEWAFVDKGRVRTTVTAPGGYEETVTPASGRAERKESGAMSIQKRPSLGGLVMVAVISTALVINREGVGFLGE